MTEIEDQLTSTDLTNNKLNPGLSDPAGLRPALLAGVIVIGVFFFGFGGWATFAPLNSAAIAPGTVIVEGNRKTLQHLEGGIVGKIFVRDGDRVVKGQTLIRLDETQPKASLQLLNSRKMTSTALEARLLAERDKQANIDFPIWLINNMSDKSSEIIFGQKTIFSARQNNMKGQIVILRQRNKQLGQEIIGLNDQVISQTKQLELIEEEIKDVSQLLEKGLARKPRFLALQREEASINGDRGQNISHIARIEQNIIETDLRVIELEGSFLNQVVEELSKVQSELLDLSEKIIAAEDVLRRLDISAPIEGIVMGLRVHTIGGVIGPGESILELVPQDDRLIIEARVNPSDIDKVRVGLNAEVRFLAFSQRNTSPVNSKVIFVSADGMIDEVTKESYFLAKVAIIKGYKKALNGEEILPGMQAEVFIITGEQTPLDYLLNPIVSSLNRAWREN